MTQAEALVAALGCIAGGRGEDADRMRNLVDESTSANLGLEAERRTINDPVWWLERAIDDLEYYGASVDPGTLLRKLRDDAYNCQHGKINSEYLDIIEEERFRMEKYGV